MDLLELLKTIGAAAGNIVTISGCLALCIRPIREKLARFTARQPDGCIRKKDCGYVCHARAAH